MGHGPGKNSRPRQRRLEIGQKPIRKVKANVVYQGDNLPLLKELESGKIDLIYIDPPFCAGSVFKSKAWGKKIVSFNDEWGGGVQSYIHWLSPRLKEFHRLLAPTGSFASTWISDPFTMPKWSLTRFLAKKTLSMK